MTTSGTLIFDAPTAPIETINLTEESENSADTSSEDLSEDEDQYLDSDETDGLIGPHDFAIIFRSDNNDINVVVPEIENFEQLEEEEKRSISQNQFLVGFLNYALNNEDWLNEYAFSLKNKTEEYWNNIKKSVSDAKQKIK